MSCGTLDRCVSETGLQFVSRMTPDWGFPEPECLRTGIFTDIPETFRSRTSATVHSAEGAESMAE
jgi:hypothetical protein